MRAGEKKVVELLWRTGVAVTFYRLPPFDQIDLLQKRIREIFDDIVLSRYSKQQIVVDLTAGPKSVSQLLYIAASSLGIENFQILARRYLGASPRPFEDLIEGEDYELQKLPAIKAKNYSLVDVVSLPLETRTELDPELILRCSKLLVDRHYDEAVVNAFKVLDQRIRLATGEPPELYGEALINRSFSPDKGKLSKGLTLNEKKGLRNLISGANAFFRNPSAHRFVDYDQVTAETVIVLVNFFLRMIEAAQGEGEPV